MDRLRGQSLIHMPTLAVALTSLGSGLMGDVFNFYYIKVFNNTYGLNDTWLNISQILFLVWNAINDPLFGYMQDFGCGRRMRWITKRRKVIGFCAPLFAISFMIAWFPWAIPSYTLLTPAWVIGMHLLVSLFMYDAFVSLILSAQCGLFTELTTNHKGRVRVVVYMEVAALIASFVIFPVDYISKQTANFTLFQICCGVVAVISMCCFIYTGVFSNKQVAQIVELEAKKSETIHIEPLTHGILESDATPPAMVPVEYDADKTFVDAIKEGFKSSGQIVFNLDFICVTAANFFHILRNVANANFLAIYTEALISPNGVLPLATVQLSLFYTGCQVVPKLMLALCWSFLNKYGAWTLTMVTLALTVVNSLVAYCVGRYFYSGLAIFFLVENCLCRALWPAVYNIFFPDVIDEDMKRHKRTHPLSTLVFTLNALFTKPAISIAPIIVVRYLSSYHYNAYIDQKKDPINIPALSDANELFDGMFLMACFYPLVCGICEAICLAPYRLKFRHKRDQEDKTEEEHYKKTNQADGENEGNRNGHANMEHHNNGYMKNEYDTEHINHTDDNNTNPDSPHHKKTADHTNTDN